MAACVANEPETLDELESSSSLGNDPMVGDCGPIVGRTFSSVERLPCGESQEGGSTKCNWTVTFELDGTFAWDYADIGESGQYMCTDGVVTITDGSQVEVSYDALADILTWDGVQYE